MPTPAQSRRGRRRHEPQREREREERSVRLPANPSAPETTVAVSDDSVTRKLTLSEPLPPDLPLGATVEIDLLGTGPARAYGLLIAYPCGSDPEKAMMAAEIMASCVARLRRACAERHSRNDVDLWTGVVRRLFWVESLLDNSSIPETLPLINLVERGVELLLHALRDDERHGKGAWSSACRTLDKALEWCTELAERAEVMVEENRERECMVEYRPLGEESLELNHPQPLLQGLRQAWQLGLDMNTLEIGTYCQGAVVAALRGQKL